MINSLLFNESKTKLMWTFNAQRIVIEDTIPFSYVYAHNKIIIVFHPRSEKNSHPNNLIVYNQDGTICKKIEAPRYKSKKMINGLKNNEHSTSINDVWTVPPHKKEIYSFWGKLKGFEILQGVMNNIYENTNKLVVIVSDYDYFEKQYLDNKIEFTKEGTFAGRH